MFFIGDRVEIIDGFAHIGEFDKVVQASSFSPTSYKLENHKGWWLQSQLKKAANQT